MKALRSNIVVRTFIDVQSVLEARLKKKGLKVLLLLLLNSVLEIFGLAALVPLILTLLDENGIDNNPVLGWFYDYAGFTNEISFMIVLCVVILTVMVLKNSLSLLILFQQAKFSYGLMKHYSSNIMRNYYAKGYSFFQTSNSNYLVRNVNHVPLQFANYVVLPLVNFLTEIAVLVFILVGIAIVDVKVIVLLSIIVIPFVLLFYRFARNRITSIKTQLHELEPQTNQNVFHSIFGFVDVMISGTREYFFERHNQNLSKRIRLWSRDFVFQNAPNKVLETALVFGLIIVSIYGLYWIDRSHLLTLISVFAVAAYRTLPSINRILVALMSLKSHRYALDLILELKKDIDWGTQLKARTDLSPMAFEDEINFDKISFQYSQDGPMVLDDLSFKVGKGERIGIVGRSGAGKTTLVNLLLRFLMETGGTIKVDGNALSNENVDRWRTLIGYVQQDVYILDATLAENIAFGCDLDNIDPEKLRKAVKLASIEEFVEALPEKENTMIGERGALVSGGQRQRIGIARALYHGAEILVFDEATSALDQETENNINNSIRELGKHNITMFVIAHRITTLKYCHRIIRLDQGKIEGIYGYDELLELSDQT